MARRAFEADPSPVLHAHAPDPEAERVRDIGFTIGVIGLAALAFTVGRATAPGSDCCERLVNRDLELILCEARLIPPSG